MHYFVVQFLQIYERVTGFNGFVRKLQKEKIALIKKCRKIEAQVKELQKLIPQNERKTIPLIHDMETIEDPEKVYHISEKDIWDQQNKKIEAAGLTKRKKMVDDLMHASSYKRDSIRGAEPKAGKRGIYKEGDFRRGRKDPRAPKVEIKKPVSTNPQQGQQYFKTFGKSSAMDGLSVPVFKYRKTFFNPKTEAMSKRKERVITARCAQRDELLLKLKRLIEYFKKRVTDVSHERVILQLDTKLMSLGLLILIQELDIVKEFDTAEKTVLERLNAQKVECVNARERVSTCRIAVDAIFK